MIKLLFALRNRQEIFHLVLIVTSFFCAKYRTLASNLAIAFRGAPTASPVGTDPFRLLQASYLFKLSNSRVDKVSRWRKTNRKPPKILSLNRNTRRTGCVKFLDNQPLGFIVIRHHFYYV